MAIALLFSTPDAKAAYDAYEPLNCNCEADPKVKSCGIEPASLKKSEVQIAHELGFDVPGENEKLSNSVKGIALYLAFAKFLEKSDRARMFYPDGFARAAKEASVLTLKSKFTPKNITEADEYFRCTIPADKYCFYRKTLRPYIALAAKASGIDFSFLACQAYVESRFSHNVQSHVGAIGYAQILPQNVQYLNEVLKRSIRNSDNRRLASAVNSVSNSRMVRISKIHHDIARSWREFWKDTKNTPQSLCKDDLTCYRQVFLAQALALKTDMLAFITSSNIKADIDENGDFRVEGFDKGDSLLLLAGSYNIGVTKMIKAISTYCSGSTKLKECVDKMKDAGSSDVRSILSYIMRIRNCTQQFSAEQLDFDDDSRWTTGVRTEKMNAQREEVTQCMLHPCPY